ncbi:unnamed protein product [Adineta steineri]|nr:unnamed protein product [Adineta steineri]
MSDTDKKINSTGGLYSTNSTNFTEVLGIMNYARSKGSGGDGPENDIEALLHGITICPMCQNIVHIADNAVTPRDMALLYQLTNKHIKVIPCQVSGRINPALLNIALQTKGSIHTIEKDYINLPDIPLNDSINISAYIYRRTVDGFIHIL